MIHHVAFTFHRFTTMTTIRKSLRQNVAAAASPASRGGAQESFADRVARRLSALTPGQRRAVRFFEQNFADCALLTASEIGERAGVSETTVIRLAYALELGGFAELQNLIRRSLIQERIERFVPPEGAPAPTGEVADDVSELDCSNIRQTLAAARRESLEKAADMLIRAPMICTIGLRSSAATAGYATAALAQLFGNVMSLAHAAGDHLDRVRGLPAGTVVFGVSFFRYAQTTLDVLRHARSRGLPTIVVTDSVTSPALAWGDVVFIASAATLHHVPSQVGGVALVDALLATMARRDPRRIAAALRGFERQLEVSDRFFHPT